MNATEQRNRHQMLSVLESLGIGYDEAQKLRRISMTLQRWFELECGTGDNLVTLSVERENGDDDGKPMLRRQYQGYGGQWIDKSCPIPDREKGARKRLTAIMAKHPSLVAYVQTDPRGCALYILHVPTGCAKEHVAQWADENYSSRGIAVY